MILVKTTWPPQVLHLLGLNILNISFMYKFYFTFYLHSIRFYINTLHMYCDVCGSMIIVLMKSLIFCLLYRMSECQNVRIPALFQPPWCILYCIQHNWPHCSKGMTSIHFPLFFNMWNCNSLPASVRSKESITKRLPLSSLLAALRNSPWGRRTRAD